MQIIFLNLYVVVHLNSTFFWHILEEKTQTIQNYIIVLRFFKCITIYFSNFRKNLYRNNPQYNLPHSFQLCKNVFLLIDNIQISYINRSSSESLQYKYFLTVLNNQPEINPITNVHATHAFIYIHSIHIILNLNIFKMYNA